MAVNPIAKSLEGILAFLKTGTFTYPAMQLNSPIADTIDEIEENLEADGSSPGFVGLGQFMQSAFDGVSAAGACTLVGAAVGDLVVGVACITAGSLADNAANFESVITVVDEIQQSQAADRSSDDFVVTLYTPLLT